MCSYTDYLNTSKIFKTAVVANKSTYVGDALDGVDTNIFQHGENALYGLGAGLLVAGLVSPLSYMRQTKKHPEKSKARRVVHALGVGLGSGLGAGLLATAAMYGKDYYNGTSWSKKYNIPDNPESTKYTIYITGTGSGPHYKEELQKVYPTGGGPGRVIVINPKDMEYGRSILDEIFSKHPDADVNFIGHSNGAREAYKLSRYAEKKGYPISRVDTLDTIFRIANIDGKPTNVKQWNNYYSDKANWRFLPDLWAILGGRHSDLNGANNVKVTEPYFANHTDMQLLALPENNFDQASRHQESNDADNPRYWWTPKSLN